MSTWKLVHIIEVVYTDTGLAFFLLFLTQYKLAFYYLNRIFTNLQQIFTFVRKFNRIIYTYNDRKDIFWDGGGDWRVMQYADYAAKGTQYFIVMQAVVV